MCEKNTIVYPFKYIFCNFLTLKTTLKTKINIHKGTRVIKPNFTLADDAMFYIIWFMHYFSFLFQRTCITHHSLTHSLLIVSLSSSSFAVISKL